MKKIAVCKVLGILCILISSLSFAERSGPGQTTSVDLSPGLEWDIRTEIGERLTAHGTDLLGDNIDPHLGSISFSHTDISLPGNSDLPVELIRNLTQGYFASYSENKEFGDWHLGVPRLTLVTAKGVTSQTNKWRGNRCSNPQSTFTQVLYQGADPNNLTNWGVPVEYSNGLLLDVPGYGSQHVLKKSTSVSQPFPASSKYVTAEGWYLICGSASDGGEGFVAVAPNGNKYKFDRYVQYNYRNLGAMSADGGNAGTTRYITRVITMLMATEVTDVHGNWVRYTYDTSNRLKKIESNDGRLISVGYSGTSATIASATANGRTWTYNYTTATISDDKVGEYGTNKKILSSVDLPDGTSWSFNLLSMHYRPSSGTYCRAPASSMSLTHPNGVTGTFSLRETYHRMGYAEWMTETTLKCSGGFVNGSTPTYEDIYHAPIETYAVTEKSVTGPDMPTSVWSYTYESDVDEERYPAGHQFEGHPIATSGDDPTNWTKVLNPDGSETTYYHLWNVLLVDGFDSSFSGKLARQEIREAPGESLLQSVDYEYVKAGVFGNSYLPKGYTNRPLVNVINPSSSGLSVPYASVITKRDGDTFTTQYEYNTTQSSSAYSYGKPIKTTVFSNVSTSPRITDTTYEHNKTLWVLNLPKTTTVNGRLTESYTYNSKAELNQHQKYGVTVATYGYSGLGLLTSVIDANNKKTELLEWKRGTPQRIKRPDASSVYQYVDNNGWLTSTKDARGNTTSLTRDEMGRLTYIDYPGSWSNTSIDYDLSGGGAVQTISKGQSIIEITYDGMFRPILERTEATDTSWVSYVNTSYDEVGRLVFKSLPSVSSVESAGTEFTYDALGRIVTEEETVSPYALTRHEYHSSHRHRVYDPSNAYTDYYSIGYEGPGNQNYRAIYHGSGAKTFITKNVWNEVTKVRQWGTQNGYSVDQTNYYYYNSQRELCRYRNATVGDTLYSYDNKGQLSAYQNGVSAGTSCTVPSGNAKVTITRDALGRVTKTDFTDTATPDIVNSYDTDGNLLTSNRGGINWTYTYNSLSLLTSEHLSVDGRSYNIDYTFDSDGSLTHQQFPSGKEISFNPDGLGRPQQAKYSSTSYVSNIDYHVNNTISSFMFGNGHSFSQTLNARLLPQRLLSYKGSNKPLDLNYLYDNRGAITSIADNSPNDHDLTMAYDGLNRLTSASGSWGSGNIVYDAMGNIRTKQLGGRTVTVNYDNKYRVTSSVDVGNVGGNTGTRTFSYDSRGNTTSVGNLSFTYDYANQPTSISGSSNGYYVYDGNLKRVKAVINGKTIYNVYSRTGSLVHIDNLSTGEVTDNISVNGLNVVRLINNSPTYLHTDVNGSPVAGTSSSGSVVFRERYTPFGITLNNNSKTDNQTGYTGHIKDTEIGLVYMQARYYDPVIGRFYSNDPVNALGHISKGNIQGFNRYNYAYNNPFKYVDPDGMEPDIFENRKRHEQAVKIQTQKLERQGYKVRNEVRMTVDMGDGDTAVRVMDIVAQRGDSTRLIEIKTMKDKEKKGPSSIAKKLNPISRTVEAGKLFIRGGFQVRQMQKDQRISAVGATEQATGAEIGPTTVEWQVMTHNKKQFLRTLPPIKIQE